MLHIKRILVPTDRSRLSERTYSHAADLARRFGSEIHLLHVRRLDANAGQDPGTPSLAASESARPPGLLAAAGPVHDVEIESSSVPWAIIGYAKEHDIDLIVMGGRGNRGTGLRRLGGVAGPVVRYAPCAVLTVRDGFPEHGIRRMLVPVDTSPASAEQIATARELAVSYQASIDLLLVLDQSLYPSSLIPDVTLGLGDLVRERWKERLEQLWSEVGGPEVAYEAHVSRGDPRAGIIDFALQTQPDLIVIGTHGRTGLQRLIMGSVAEAVVYQALAATLTLKTFGRPLLAAKPAAGAGTPSSRPSARPQEW